MSARCLLRPALLGGSLSGRNATAVTRAGTAGAPERARNAGRGSQPRCTVVAALALGLSGCAASLPPEAQPKPYSVLYAKQTLVALKPSWIIVHPESVRNARVGKFQTLLVDQTAVCVAYDAKDRSGVYAGVKPYIVFIAADHGSIVQVVPPTPSFPCTPDELQPFPELNSVK